MPEAGPSRRGGRRWAAAALAAALGLAVMGAGNLYLVSTTRAAIAAGVEAAPRRPQVIVLGTFVGKNGFPSRELAQRLETARALYAAGRADRIIVSGMVREAYDEPHAMAAWLERHGVPPAAIVLDLGGHRTAATMANAAALGVRQALISTQAYHLPRALYLARHAGIDAVGVTAAPGRPPSLLSGFHLRESLARVEIIFEVALRGVRG